MVIDSNIQDTLKELSITLSQANIPRASREAQLFVMAFLEVDELWLLTNQQTLIPHINKLYEMVQRRVKGEPFEYIVNKVSFYSQEFYIAPGALIPRPETELLIDEILKNKSDLEEKIHFVEVGVGSGIISILLALKYKNANIIAVDISQDALDIAKINIVKFHLEHRIELRLGSLLDTVEEKIDYLVSNPPYIEEGVKLESHLDYEPQNALFGGKIGDEIIKKLLDDVLRRNIKFFSCEMGYDQKGKMSYYLKDKNYKDLEFYQDYANLDRGFTLRL